MKRLLVIFGFAVLTLTTSCVKDTYNFDDALKGSWNLVQVSGGLAGLDEQIAPGKVSWTFDGSGEIIVNNTVGVNQGGVLESGKFDYNVINSNGNTFLVIENNEFGIYAIQNGELRMDEAFTSDGVGKLDGFKLFFQR